jgi:preprotein translocase subunit SecY
MQNYYKPPQSAVENEVQTNDGSKTGVIDELRRTAGWVLFIAILIFIAVAFLFLSGIILLIAGAGLSAVDGPWQALPLGPMLAGGAVVLLAMGVVYLFAGIYLTKFKSAIERLARTSHDDDLANAMEQQRKFWKLWSIVFIISTVVTILWTAVAILLPDTIANMLDFQGMLSDIPQPPVE